MIAATKWGLGWGCDGRVFQAIETRTVVRWGMVKSAKA